MFCRQATLWVLLGAVLLAPSPARAQCFPPGDLHRTTWEWVQSVGGVAGTRRTPETDGVTRQLTIDVATGTWDYLEDEAFSRRETVSLSCQSVPVHGEVLVKVCDGGVRPCTDQALTLAKPTSTPWRLIAEDVGVLDGHRYTYELRAPLSAPTEASRWSTVKTRFGG